jgi:hypothetical protein
MGKRVLGTLRLGIYTVQPGIGNSKHPNHPSLRHSMSSMLFSLLRPDAISLSIVRMRSISLCMTLSTSVLLRPAVVWARGVSTSALLMAQRFSASVSRKRIAADSDFFPSSSARTSASSVPCSHAGRVRSLMSAARDDELALKNALLAQAAEEKERAGQELRKLQKKLDESLLSRNHALITHLSRPRQMRRKKRGAQDWSNVNCKRSSTS